MAAAESQPVTPVDTPVDRPVDTPVDPYYYIDWEDFEVKPVDSMDDERFIKTQKVIRVLDCYKDLTAGGALPRDITNARLDKYKLALILGYGNEIADKASGYELKDIEGKIRNYFLTKGLIEEKFTKDVQDNKKGVEIAFEESGKNPEAYLKDVLDDGNNLKIGNSFANILDTGPSSGKTTRKGTYYELFEDIGIFLCLTEQLKNFGFDNCSLEVKYTSGTEIDFCLTIDGEIIGTMKTIQKYALGNRGKNSWIRKMIAKEHIDKLIDPSSTKQDVLTTLRVLFKIKAMGDTLQIIMLNENISKRDYKDYYMVSGDNVVHDSLMLINKNSIYKLNDTLEIFTAPSSTTLDKEITSFEKSFERIETLNVMKIQKLEKAYYNKNDNVGTQILKPNGQRVSKQDLQLLLGKINSHIEVLRYFNELVLDFVKQTLTDEQKYISVLRQNKVLIKNMNLLDKLQIKGRKKRNHYTLVGLELFKKLLDDFKQIVAGVPISGGTKTKNKPTNKPTNDLSKPLVTKSSDLQKKSRPRITDGMEIDDTTQNSMPTMTLEPFMEEERPWLNNDEWVNATREILRLYYSENKLDGKDIDNQILIQAYKLFNILLDNEPKLKFESLGSAAGALMIEENDRNKKSEENSYYDEESYVQLDTTKEKERLTNLLGRFNAGFSPFIRRRGGSSKNASKYGKKRQTKKKRKYIAKRRTQNKKRSKNPKK